jgi:peptide deformylase
MRRRLLDRLKGPEDELPRIVQAGDPVLRAVAAPVDPVYLKKPEFKELVRTMTAVMRAAPGVGLAAPQIGIGLQVIVLEDEERLMGKLAEEERAVRGRVPFPLKVIVNPTLTVHGDRRATFFEGCLSVAGWSALVERDLEVEVSGLDEHGAPLSWRVAGWPARILQHEVDHLRGTLYIDRMLTRSFGINEEVAKRWMHLSVDEVRAALKA